MGPLLQGVQMALARKQGERADKLKAQTNALMPSAYSGDQGAMEELMRVNPEAGMRIGQVKRKAEQQKMQQSRQISQDRQKRGAELRERVEKFSQNVSKFSTFEDSREFAERELKNMSEQFPEIISRFGDAVYDEEDFKQAKTLNAKPEKAATGFQGLVKSFQDAPEGSEEKKLFEQKIAKEVSNRGMTFNKDGSVTFGAMPLDKSNKREAIKTVVSAAESLERLEYIDSKLDPDFLTYGFQFKQWAAGKARKLGAEIPPEMAAKRRQYREWVQSVNFEFNAYRKLITGAAAAQSELEDLKKAVINPDLDIDEWRGAMDSYKAELRRSLRLRNKFLREGLSLSDKSSGLTFSEGFSSGLDDDMNDRGDELIAGGMSPDDVMDQLEKEGYE